MQPKSDSQSITHFGCNKLHKNIPQRAGSVLEPARLHYSPECGLHMSSRKLSGLCACSACLCIQNVYPPECNIERRQRILLGVEAVPGLHCLLQQQEPIPPIRSRRLPTTMTCASMITDEHIVT